MRRWSSFFLLAVAPLTPVAAAQPQWVASWATAVMADDPGSALPPTATRDVTLRQFVRLSIGGKRLRLRLTNAFGSAPLELDSVSVAPVARGIPAAIDASASRQVRFNGSGSIVIPTGAEYASDPIDLPVTGLTTLAISLHFRKAPARQTVHYVSRSISYIAPGNQTGAGTLFEATRVEHWYQLAGVDVATSRSARAIAILGDSITDGHGATLDANDRWTDVLADRLQADRRTRHIAVVNLGISGNRLLKDGGGPAGMARLNREVLSQPGIRTLIVFEGVNDLGDLSREGPVTPERREAVVRGVIDAYAQILAYAHARGIRVVGSTILPFGGTHYYRSDADANADRQRVNTWILAPGHFDAVINFDAVVRDPEHPERLRSTYDSGDLLHPSAVGYRAMGSSITLQDLVP